MKKFFLPAILGLFCLLVSLPQVEAQGSFIKKVKKKAEDAAIDKMFEPADKSEEAKTTNTLYNQNDSDDGNSPENTRGGGLNSSAPDVMENIRQAGVYFDNNKYRDARFAVRQAILGVELEIGGKVLADLPKSIGGLPVVESEDQVTSSGIGFVGLIIQRVYRDKDQELRVTIGNDAAMLSAVNLYFSSGAYTTSSQEENVKQTTFQDERAVIQFGESEGYQLNVPFGQSSIFMTQGINYDSEDDFMSSSNEIKLTDIKTQLGEK